MTYSKSKLKNALENARENWYALSILVKMQLKEKMDMSYLRSLRKIIFKAAWVLIEFSAIVAVLAVIFHYVKVLGLFSLVRDIPVSVISLIFAVMLLFSVITDTAGLMRSLYFSKDNSVLLTLPTTPSLVFFSKLATYYVYELRKSFMFTIPIFIAFGISKGYGIYYYPWLFLMFTFISTVPVLISGLLSIPAMYVYVFLSRRKAIQYALYITAAIAGIALSWRILGLIPDDINFIESWGNTYWDIQNFLKRYTEIFSPIYNFTELIVGKTVGLTNVIFHSDTLKSPLALAAIDLTALFLCFLFSKPLFCKMAATPFEYSKKISARKKKNRKLTPFISALKKELLSGLRSNYLIKLFGTVAVIMPMTVYLLGKIYGAMRLNFLGRQMSVCFSVMIMLLILTLSNIDLASAYSRDGSCAYLNKIQPASHSLLLFSKLFFNLVICLFGTVLTTIIFASFKILALFDSAMVGITVYTVYVIHLFFSAESDITNPQYEQYATFSEQSANPNESASSILSILISSIIFTVALLLSSTSAGSVWIKLAAITTVLSVFKAITYVAKIKAFYKEN